MGQNISANVHSRSVLQNISSTEELTNDATELTEGFPGNATEVNFPFDIASNVSLVTHGEESVDGSKGLLAASLSESARTGAKPDSVSESARTGAKPDSVSESKMASLKRDVLTVEKIAGVTLTSSSQFLSNVRVMGCSWEDVNGKYQEWGMACDCIRYRNTKGWVLFRHVMDEIPELGIYADGCYAAAAEVLTD